ncbi:MAG: hypothetical protein WAT20_06595 [Ferruginibacter sp.]|nr:hypothetical protein [Chitinophagaceae bacterium]
MDFKKSYLFLSALVAVILFFESCSDQKKNNIDNTYYIELVNFNHDSLKNDVSAKLFGKASFYKNKELQILSVNYLTEDYPDIHFYKNASELTNEIKPETKKIRIEFGGVFTLDSIKYSLQKFVYRDKQWKKTSDMGFITAINTYFKTSQYTVDQFGKEILYNTITYTYN